MNALRGRALSRQKHQQRLRGGARTQIAFREKRVLDAQLKHLVGANGPSVRDPASAAALCGKRRTGIRAGIALATADTRSS
eukprot:6200200-Pleurochrysis_carterae.AAC.2